MGIPGLKIKGIRWKLGSWLVVFRCLIQYTANSHRQQDECSNNYSCEKAIRPAWFDYFHMPKNLNLHAWLQKPCGCHTNSSEKKHKELTAVQSPRWMRKQRPVIRSSHIIADNAEIFQPVRLNGRLRRQYPSHADTSIPLGSVMKWLLSRFAISNLVYFLRPRFSSSVPHSCSWFFPTRRSGSICKESQFNSSRHWPLCYTWIGYRQANGFRREPCYLKSWITSTRCQHSSNAHCSNLTVITTPCRCCQISKCIILTSRPYFLSTN